MKLSYSQVIPAFGVAILNLRSLICAFAACGLVLAFAQRLSAQHPTRVVTAQSQSEVCLRAPESSEATDATELRSRDGILKVELTFRNYSDSSGQMRYCYVSKDGLQAPTLRVNPGDTLVIRLKNDLSLPASATAENPMHLHSAPDSKSSNDRHRQARDICAGGPMTADATNLHFHGLVIPPVCHQDETLKTLIQPSDPPFEYRIKIPPDSPPGLYWYHPHPHGFSKAQVLGGASGALIVEGIEQIDPELAGLPERVLVVRDQDLVNPNAEPVDSPSIPAPIVLRDAEGDIMNTGTGTGKPAKDLSINFVPVPYPEYQPAVIPLRPMERQFWRVLNASAITYLDLQLLVNDKPQLLGVVAVDGLPFSEAGTAAPKTIWQSHIAMPPAGRAEFIVRGLPDGAKASLVTRTVDTGPAGENDPTRPLAIAEVKPNAPETQSRLPVKTNDARRPAVRLLVAKPRVSSSHPAIWLGDIQPVRQRKLYFSEEPLDPKDPNSPTKFYITVEGQVPKQFDPTATTPNIVVRQGDVEDWTIENRTRELHAFHIHQVHFLMTMWNGVPIDEPYLRDTVNVAYWDSQSPQYPSVTLRMDFRDPAIVGTFVYHCHLLEHEDGGMMGTIEVVPPTDQFASPTPRH